jgi:hypothetical protein
MGQTPEQHTRANEGGLPKTKKAKKLPPGASTIRITQRNKSKKMHAVAVQPVALQSCKKGEEGKPYVVSFSCIRTQAFLAWAVQFIRFIF